MPGVRITAEAAQELEEAAAWYEQEMAGVGSRLIDAFEHALTLLQDPYPPLMTFHGEADALGAKRLILHRFPFSLVVVDQRGERVVVAFAHHARRPGYWKGRLGV